MSVLDLIQSLGEAEDSLTETEFVSPVFHTDSVVMWVKGLVHRLKIPKARPGWYRIRPTDTWNAEIVSEADLMDIESYLNRFPRIRLVLVSKQGDYHLGVPLKSNAYGLQMHNPLPVFLVNDMPLLLDTVICGFDGSSLWYADLDMANDPAKGDYLRDSFDHGKDPSEIRFKGLSIEEKLAYGLRCSLDVNHRERLKEIRLKKDVEFAGGKFVKFEERKDHYSVTYDVDGNQYTSYISKDPIHQVLTAGICLEGGDKEFDLKSLISVIREGQGRNLIHRFHNTE